MNFIHAVKSLPGPVDDALGARPGVMPAVVHTGRMVERPAPDVLAVPWWRAL